MILRSVLLPEKVDNFYLFSKRVVGFDINRSHVIATVILLKGSKVIIEQVIEEKLDMLIDEHEERVSQVVKKIINQVPSYNEVRIAIPSSLVVFKELYMPFLEYEKIKMALDFEVDPLLPFSVQDAVVDFIVTKTYAEEKSTDILVAAVQKQHIIKQLSLFEKADISPAVITVDLFALYGLYKKIPEYQKEVDNVALIDLGSQVTSISYIKDQKLSYVRSVPQGISGIVKKISKDLNIEPGKAVNEVIKFSTLQEDSESKEIISRAMKEFWQKIQFTLDRFHEQDKNREIKKRQESEQESNPKEKDKAAKFVERTSSAASEQKILEKDSDELKELSTQVLSEEDKGEKVAISPEKSKEEASSLEKKDESKSTEISVVEKQDAMLPAVKKEQKDKEEKIVSFVKDEPLKSENKNLKIILLGLATDIEGLASFLQKELGLSCSIFNMHSLQEDASIVISNQKVIKSTMLMSLSIALPSEEVEFFNLRQKELSVSSDTLLLKQLIVAGALIAILFITLISTMIMQNYNLSSERQQLEEQTVTEIKERFKNIDEEEENSEELIESAEESIKKQEAVLKAFLRSSSHSALSCLLELTKRLNAKELGLKVEQIIITNDLITLKARVRDYDALKILEFDLSQSPLFGDIEPQDDPHFTMEIMLKKKRKNGNY